VKKRLEFEKVHYDAPTYSGWNLETFQEVAGNYATEWGIPVENVHFSVDYSRGYYDSIDVELTIKGFRLETDEEEAEREAEEKAAKAHKSKLDKERRIREAEIKAQTERAEYERLKKIFEKELNNA